MSKDALTETPDVSGAYPSLSDEQLASLRRMGEERPTQTGDVLYREGDDNGDFFVILEGQVAIIEESPTGERTIGVHGPRRFLGELGLLVGQPVFLTAVVREPGRVLVLTAEQLRMIVTGDQVLGDLILRALLLRRSILIGLGVGLRIIGSRHSPDTRRLRDFAIRNRLPHHWIDLESDPGAEQLLRRVGVQPTECPVVLLGEGGVLRNPSNRELAQILGLRQPRPERSRCDLVVVGAGPAGLAAAVYGASEGLVTVVLEALATGGQAGTSSRIENYLGFPAGISGAELAERATLQARKFGAELVVPAEGRSLEIEDGSYLVSFDGDAVAGRTVVIATGVHYRRLPVPGIAELEGISVHYAATLMEAQLCRGDPVVAVGGGNSAGQAVLFLSRYVPRLTLVIREHELGENMSRYLADRIERTPTIRVLPHAEVREVIVDDDVLEAVIVEDNRTGERHRLDARALFVFIGAEPHTEWLRDRVALDDGGYIVTGADAAAAALEHGGNGSRRSPLLLETSLEGVFAAGDVRSGSTPRVSAAVGDGAIAIRHAYQLLAGHMHAVRLAQTYVSSK